MSDIRVSLCRHHQNEGIPNPFANSRLVVQPCGPSNHALLNYAHMVQCTLQRLLLSPFAINKDCALFSHVRYGGFLFSQRQKRNALYFYNSRTHWCFVNENLNKSIVHCMIYQKPDFTSFKRTANVNNQSCFCHRQFMTLVSCNCQIDYRQNQTINYLSKYLNSLRLATRARGEN